jgi:hypothetical protein
MKLLTSLNHKAQSPSVPTDRQPAPGARRILSQVLTLKALGISNPMIEETVLKPDPMVTRKSAPQATSPGISGVQDLSGKTLY